MIDECIKTIFGRNTIPKKTWITRVGILIRILKEREEMEEGGNVAANGFVY